MVFFKPFITFFLITSLSSNNINLPEKEILEDLVIVIDAGHQEKANNDKEQISPNSKEKKPKVSSGTKGVFTGKPEYQLNLEVALKLRDRLTEKKVNVVMIRETNNVDISNVERALIANNANSDLVIRLHADGSNNKSVNGFTVLVPGDKSINDKSIIEKSYKVGESVLIQMKENLEIKSRGLSKRNDLTGFNWLEVPGILIEMGFMSNASDDQIMSKDDYQNKLVNSIVEGIENYFKK